MKLISKIVVRPDAPMHIYTNLSRHRYESTNFDLPHCDDDEIYAPNDLPKVEFNLNDFRVEIELNLDEADNPLVKGHYTFASNLITVTLIREIVESELSAEQATQRYRQGYLTTLHVVVNRLTSFFRYQLGNPFLRRLNAGHIETWEWLDSNGTVLLNEPRGTLLDRFPGGPDGPNSLGSKSFKRSQVPNLLRALVTPIDLSAAYELRAQAQEAIFEGKGFLAVLLLAVSSEVAIKTAFFRRDSIASDAFDYLEEKRQVEVSPVELVNKVAKRAFGQSFSEHNQSAFDSLDNLFRCRNKIAHRAKATFRDKKENLTSPTAQSLVDWWNTVTCLQTWLESKCGELPSNASTLEDHTFALDAWRDVPTEMTGSGTAVAR